MPTPLPRADDPDLLTVKEVAAQLRVGKSTVYRLLDADEIAKLRIGRSIRIPRASLDRYLDQGGTDLDVYLPQPATRTAA